MRRHRLVLVFALAASVATRAYAQPTLTAVPLEVSPDVPVTVTVTGVPGQAWAVGGSLYGAGLVFQGDSLALGTDVVIVGTGVLDASGTVSFSVRPPPSFTKSLFYLQAITAADSSFAGAQPSASVTLRPASLFTNAPLFPQGLSAGGARITSVGAPAAPTDAANKEYVDSVTGDGVSGSAGGDLAGTYPNPSIASGAGANIVGAINASGGTIADSRVSSNIPRLDAANTFSGVATFSAGLFAANARIQNVGAPAAASDAATKAYVDSLTGGSGGLQLGQFSSVSNANPLLWLEQTGAGLLMRLRTNSPTVPGSVGIVDQDMFTVRSDGGFVAGGELGGGLIPATGAGWRTMWYPFKAAFRTGGVDGAGNHWDDANIGFYSFAGGHNATARAFGTFAYGDNIDVSGTNAVGFGSASTVSGTLAFSTGASNIASGFGSLTAGFTMQALGQGSVAIGYRSASCGDYSVALGHRASSSSVPTTGSPCGGTAHRGAFIFGDASTTAHFGTTADNEFAARAAGGFRFRTNIDGTTVCDLPPGSGVFSCSSDRNLKSDFSDMDGEDVLRKMARVPVTTWRFIDEASGVRHAGPMAQDFFEAFGLGSSDRMIGYTDINGINMRAIQALERRTRDLESADERIRTLEERLERIEAQLDAMSRSRR